MTKTLKRNICNLRTPGAAPHEVDRDEYHHNLPANVQYACLYLFEHFSQAGHDLLESCDDDDQVYRFFQEHFVHWLEALSLTVKISEGVFIITKFESMLEVSKFSILSCDSSIFWLCAKFSLRNIMLCMP